MLNIYGLCVSHCLFVVVFSLDWKEYEQRFKSSHISNEAKFSNHIHSLYSVDKNVSFESVEKMH